MKTSELTGAALNWAVAKCMPDDTLAIYFDEATGEPLRYDDWEDNQEYKPSTYWSQGGPIIDREGITLRCGLHGWDAELPEFGVLTDAKSALEAAMRCYVASKLGDAVNVPEGLG